MRFFIFLLAFAVGAPLFACDCLPVATFCETIANTSGGIDSTRQIDLIRVINADENGIDVKVLRSYNGADLSNQKLRFIRGNSANCISSLHEMNIGEEYIFAGRGYQENWYLSDCGVTFLRVKNNQIQGPVAPNLSSMSLSEFSSAMLCSTPFQIYVLPTLHSQSTAIYTAVDAPFYVDIVVFDVLGRILSERRVHNFSVDHPIVVDMDNWNTGLHIVLVKGENWKRAFKVIKTTMI